jgi:putative flavoprotein involved in K+ transport
MKTESNLVMEQWDTIIIGAGQAGLATGYHLQKLKNNFIIIDSADRIGDSWRQRWDSLRLFTPSQYDGLPGFQYPALKGTYPSKNELADYLEEYSKRFNLPVRMGVVVIKLGKRLKGFEIITTAGTMLCNKVVIATGAFHKPKIPAFAKELDESIFQIHSSEYMNPQTLPPGNVLVVGSGVSGVEIAVELSTSRHTLISGHPPLHIPDPLLKYAGRFYWWFINNVLTVSTPMGRKVKQKVLKGGSPLIRISVGDLERAGVARMERVSGIENGKPKLTDGRIISVSSIVWATGYKPDFSWIDMPVINEKGWPLSKKGVSTQVEGLYFIGMLFQRSLSSSLVGGVGRDADFIARHIQQHIRNEAK